MDRRRRVTPDRPFNYPTPRMLRRPLALIRRALQSIELVYIAISLFIFLFVAFSIFALEERSSIPSVFPLTALKQPSAGNVPIQTAFHAAGSTQQLDVLLARVTNATTRVADPQLRNGRIVVAVAVNYAFRELALNFVCNLKRLGVSNYVVLAMDRAVYDYLRARKANTFFYAFATHRRLLMDDGDEFGSSAFVETSRRKSLLVLKVLQLGYSVVFSDVDVVWIRNPIPVLLQHKFDFVIQSDRSSKDQGVASNYNLNSGFYLVRSSERSITALQAIVKYAAAIRRSEQKAFNYVLCGAFKDHNAGPGLRVGSDSCTYRKNGATAFALPLETFPNGSNLSFWDNTSSSFVAKHPDVIAIHANYISGRLAKVERIRKIGFWFHSEESERLDRCIVKVPRGLR